MSTPSVEIFCGDCRKQVLGGQRFMEYGGVTYHDYCLTCTKCRRPVGDEKFCTHEGRIYCQKDYDNLFGVKCGVCGQVIEGQMVESNLHPSGFLHPGCLRCDLCGKTIGGEEYFPNDGGIPYCSRDCKHKAATGPVASPEKPAARASPVVIKVVNDVCSACGKDVYNLDKMDMMNRLWHKKCFKCFVCQVKLTPTSYLGSGGNPYCKVHYPAPTPTSLPL